MPGDGVSQVGSFAPAPGRPWTLATPSVRPTVRLRNAASTSGRRPTAVMSALTVMSMPAITHSSEASGPCDCALQRGSWSVSICSGLPSATLSGTADRHTATKLPTQIEPSAGVSGPGPSVTAVAV
jgi:hypothetical protein